MGEQDLWVEMCDVLKDISNYLAKQDATQEKASIDTPPKTKEKQKEIVGGADPAAKPGEVGFAKGFENIPATSGPNKKESIDESGESQLKKAEEEDEKEDDDGEEESDSDEAEELKSLLKDIKAALLTKSEDNTDEKINSAVNKALPNAMDKMLRKMGYSISKPDVTKLGVEDGILKKSIGDSSAITKMSDEDKLKEANESVDKMSKMSWGELAKLREQTGDGFRGFPR